MILNGKTLLDVVSSAARITLKSQCQKSPACPLSRNWIINPTHELTSALSIMPWGILTNLDSLCLLMLSVEYLDASGEQQSMSAGSVQTSQESSVQNSETWPHYSHCSSVLFHRDTTPPLCPMQLLDCLSALLPDSRYNAFSDISLPG